MVTFKVLHNPSIEEGLSFFDIFGVTPPDGFLTGSETNISYFCNDTLAQVMIGKRNDNNAKTKFGGVTSETIDITQNGGWLC